MNPHASPGSSQSFTYGFMTFQCAATLDANKLSVKQGLRTFEASVPKLRHLFVQQSGSGTQQALVLAEERRPGKNKILRLYANPGDPGFLAFVNAILTLRPDIDLRGLDEKTALLRFIDTRTGGKLSARALGALAGVSHSTVARMRHTEGELTIHA